MPDPDQNPPVQGTPAPAALADQPQMVDFDAILRQVGVEENVEQIKKLQVGRKGNPVVTLVLNHYQNYFLSQALIKPLYEVLTKVGKGKQLDVFLHSTGGIAEVPWHIVAMLREFSERIAVMIPFVASSGATHIAIAADELLMGEISILGSVDPSRNHPLLPRDPQGKQIPASVQDFAHCLTFIESPYEAQGKKISRADIVAELFKYVNPLALGAIDRSNQLSRLITRKVLGTRKKPLTKKQVELIVEKLASAYFSHSFPITRRDVKSDLKLQVTYPDEELWQCIWQLYEYYDRQFQTQRLVGITNPSTGGQGPPLLVRYLGFIDSLSMRKVIYGVHDPSGNRVAESILTF